MAAFDVVGAKAAGYSDEEIAHHLGEQSKFDVDGALKSGYTPADIIEHLSTPVDSRAANAPGVLPPPLPVGLRTGTLGPPRDAPVMGAPVMPSAAILPTIAGAILSKFDPQSEAPPGPWQGKIPGPILGAPILPAGSTLNPGEIQSQAENGLLSRVKAARTPNPDLAMVHAASPHVADTDFSDHIATTRANMQRGATLSDTPITDPKSAVKAAQAAMDEKMNVLEAHKVNSRRAGNTMDVQDLRDAAKAAIPNGYKLEDPKGYQAMLAEIDGLYAGRKTLNTDEVFDVAHENNGKLSRFHASPESSQNSKLVTNSGDTAVLKSIGDKTRQWIADNVGPLAANENSEWGQLNGMKHYLQSKIVPSLKEQPITPFEGMLEKLGINPESVSFSKPGGLIKGVIKKAAGAPTKIDALLKSAFENTEAGMPPVEPNLTPHRLTAPEDSSFVRSVPAQYGAQRLLGSPDIVTPPPTDGSYVGSLPGQPGFRVGDPANSPRLLPAANPSSAPLLEPDLSSPHGDVLRQPQRNLNLQEAGAATRQMIHDLLFPPKK